MGDENSVCNSDNTDYTYNSISKPNSIKYRAIVGMIGVVSASDEVETEKHNITKMFYAYSLLLQLNLITRLYFTSKAKGSSLCCILVLLSFNAYPLKSGDLMSLAKSSSSP